MRLIDMNPAAVNDIGRLGENEYTRARFNISAWAQDYPDASYTLLNLRNGDNVAYPVPSARTDDGCVIWNVTNADLTSEGLGKCELILLDGGVKAKSIIYITRVLPALDGSGEVPDAWESWQEVFAGLKADAESAASDAEMAAQAVQDMGVSASTLTPGSDATVTKSIDPETGAVTLTFGIPQGQRGEQGIQGEQGIPGQDGADGHSPVVTASKSGGVTTVSVDGTPIATINDGENGQDGAPGADGKDGKDGADGTDGKDGQDGHSPVVTASKAGTTTTISVDGSPIATIEDGTDGQDGQDGSTPNLTIGTVTTLEPGSDATAEITGTAPNLVMNLGIPEGDPGEVTQEEFDALVEYVHDLSPVATVSGAIAAVDDAAPLDAEDVVVDIAPVQDLHGYDSPWPAGGGKNLLNVTATSDTINGVTFTVNPDGTVLVNGTATAEAVFILNLDVGIGAGTYIASGAPNGTGSSYVIQARVDGGYKNIFASQQLDVSTGITIVLIDVKSGVNVNNVILKPMICLSTASEPSTFAPYSNVCPITGWTGAEVTVNEDEIDIAFPAAAGTVYGGTLDVTSGVLTVDRANIVSYAGETLPSTWISDRDVYSAGSIPTTGAQVVYELATPVTYQLTPHEIALLRGSNTLFADTGGASLTYRQDVGILLGKLTAQVAALNSAVANS